MYAWIAGATIFIALMTGAYTKGCSDERERFNEFKAAVKLAADAQEARARMQAERAKADTEEANRVHAARVDALVANHRLVVTKLQQRIASSSIVPPVPPTTGGSESGAADDTICFSREKLRTGVDASVGRLSERFANSVQGGASAIANFQTCAEWAIRASHGAD